MCIYKTGSQMKSLVKVKKLIELRAYSGDNSTLTPLATESWRAGELNN